MVEITLNIPEHPKKLTLLQRGRERDKREKQRKIGMKNEKNIQANSQMHN